LVLGGVFQGERFGIIPFNPFWKEFGKGFFGELPNSFFQNWAPDLGIGPEGIIFGGKAFN